jgi:hypothetical protein
MAAPSIEVHAMRMAIYQRFEAYLNNSILIQLSVARFQALSLQFEPA